MSIKMAKQQDLALNPSRLSGLCGRLKCCLRYELTPSARGGAPRRGLPGQFGDEAPPGAGGCGGVRVRIGCRHEPAARSRSPLAIRPASAPRSRPRPRLDPRVTRGLRRPCFYGAINTPGVSRPAGSRPRPAASAYDAIVAAVGDAMSGRGRCHRDGADQQGGLRAGRPAVARPHGAAGAPDRRAVGRDDVLRRGAARRAGHDPRAAGRGAAACSPARRSSASSGWPPANCRASGLARPRLAMCGLNPHAGEGGVLGGEEQRVIEPAIEACRARRDRRRGAVSRPTRCSCARRAASSTPSSPATTTRA